MVEHNEEGSLGFVLNQPMNLSLNDVVEVGGEKELDIPLYSGGPVGSDTLHVVHQLGDHVTDSKVVSEHVFWGGDFEQIKFLLANKNADWKDFRFFVGYSGWAPGQLQEELKLKSWIVARGKESQVFNLDTAKLWEALMEGEGGKYKFLKKSPLKPDWN